MEIPNPVVQFFYQYCAELTGDFSSLEAIKDVIIRCSKIAEELEKLGFHVLSDFQMSFQREEAEDFTRTILEQTRVCFLLQLPPAEQVPLKE